MIPVIPATCRQYGGWATGLWLSRRESKSRLMLSDVESRVACADHSSQNKSQFVISPVFVVLVHACSRVPNTHQECKTERSFHARVRTKILLAGHFSACIWNSFQGPRMHSTWCRPLWLGAAQFCEKRFSALDGDSIHAAQNHKIDGD